MKPLLALFVFNFLICDSIHGQNLIPNHSFERVNVIDSFFCPSYYVFNRKMSQWNSPTQSSPDIIHEPYREKMTSGPGRSVRENFFITPLKPKTGKIFVGIKVYGCESPNTHCREYLQIQTLEKMEIGKCYEFSYYTSPLTNGSRVNNLGVAFSDKAIKDINKQDVLELDNRYGEKEIIAPGPGKWQQIKGTIQATSAWNYMIIGNFFHDSETKEISNKGGYRWGYYMVDEVSLIPVDCKTGVPTSEPLLTTINFESNSSTIENDQLQKLEQLLEKVSEHNFSFLNIIGHADEDGNQEYNQKLSLERAISVKNILVELGVDSEKIKVESYGENRPISKNDKLKNRRVEVEIIF